MDNKMIFENYLLVLKSTVEVFVHGTLESSNSDVREILKNGLDNIMMMQASTYDLMKNNNWYQMANIDAKTIKDTLTKLENQN